MAQSLPLTDSPLRAGRASTWPLAAVAKEVSVDPTASDGGNIGRIDPSTLRPELRDALKNITAGKTTSIVRTVSGYAILKVISASHLF